MSKALSDMNNAIDDTEETLAGSLQSQDIGLNMLLYFYYYYAIFVSVPTYMYVVKFMVTDLILIYSPWLPVNPVCIGPYILIYIFFCKF